MRNLCHWLVLLTAVLLPAHAHAESLTFRSEVTTNEFTATIGGDLSLPKGKSRNLTGGKMCSNRLYRSDIRYGIRRDDAFNAMVALQRHANISKENIFLLGLSDGGSAALLSAKGGPVDHFRAIASYYPDCGKLLGGVGYVYKSPIIVFVGEKDDWTPPAECIKSKSPGVVTGAEFEVISYPNAYHGFDQPRPMRKVLGYTMAYDREATVDSRKRYIEFFINNLTAELKAAPSFSRKAK